MNDDRLHPASPNAARSAADWRKRTLVVVVLVAGFAAGSYAFFARQQSPSDENFKRAAQALLDEDYNAAERHANLALDDQPQSGRALMIAGEAAAKLRRYGDAVNYYGQIPEQDPAAPLGLAAAADILLKSGQLAEAAARLRRLVLIDPADQRAARQMAFVLDISGQRWAAERYLFQLVRTGNANLDELLLLGDRRTLLTLPRDEEVDDSRSAVDPFVVLALAKQAVRRQEWDVAEPLLLELIVNSPKLVEAHAQLGILRQESSPLPAWQAWQAALPSEADQHPDIWVVRGNLAAQTGNIQTAARCYYEALRLDPNHRQANYLLGQTLTSLDRASEAAPFFARSELMQQLEQVLFEIYHAADRTADPELLRRAAELSTSVGRYWEAYEWANHAVAAGAPLSWATPFVEQTKVALNAIPPRTHRPATPVSDINLSDYPLPQSDATNPTEDRRPSLANSTATITFADVTSAAGIHFTYFNGGNAAQETKKMYEFTGGGIAVLDYDNDGWPDIYFTQGCNWPPVAGQTEYLDRLYRNRGDGTFEDVTAAAGIVEDRFSQGVTAGDYNNDGYTDLYVANIGRNRLYKNNGDGTFSDVDDSIATQDEAWTTSCAIADFNGDGHPDIYAVNYLTAADIYDVECEFPSGYRGLCPPQRFEGQQDRLFLGTGDGQFRDATDETGIRVPNGKGLGLLVADFTGNRHLDIFVANDGVANFFFRNTTPTDSQKLRFTEQGLASGTALNFEGVAEAGMGIACGDVNGDGHLDLFVTNYYQESNTLYLGRGAGFFEDATRRAGLHIVSLPFLGFGTQFLDADLDGDLDLVIANGHVDNPPGDPKPYHMRPQLFRNDGTGRFQESAAQSLGPYFEAAHLGRALAKIDFDGDGLEDILVSHLDAPVVLLKNTTQRPGNSLTLRLRATGAPVDALGTTVIVAAGKKTWQRQLTAGDGYQASNERQLVFGLGRHSTIDRLQIHWPSGHEQVFTDVAVGQTLEIIEGEAPQPIVRKRPTADTAE